MRHTPQIVLFAVLFAACDGGETTHPVDPADVEEEGASADQPQAADAGRLDAGRIDASTRREDAMVSTPTDASARRDAADREPCKRGQVRPSQVVMMGDSFYHLTEIPQQLWENARDAGSLASDETYRHYYLSAAMMAADGVVPAIPTQWDDAIAEDPDIKVVIWNGGGNDVLIADRSCVTEAPPANAMCSETLENVRRVARETMDKMAAAGVEQVVWAMYPHMPTWGLFQGDAPAINEMIDYAQELSQHECATSVAPRCHFVSTREAFAGHDDYLNFLDVHASPAGSKVAGALIWKVMSENCIAQ